ncbi:AIPR family protein [Acinetobacter sp. ANC 5502]
MIIATNKQTEVKDEAFESIKPYHRDLEDFFKAKIGNLSNPIYYERRSKEYFNDPKIKNDQIITLAALTKAYIATVLEQPQSTHRYFGELISSNDEQIFKNNGMFIKHFISSFMVNKISMLFKYKDLRSEYKIYIYHIAFIIYLKLHKEKLKDDEILNILDKKDQLLFYAINACKIIAIICKKEKNPAHSQIRSKDFTNKIKEKIHSFNFK